MFTEEAEPPAAARAGSLRDSVPSGSSVIRNFQLRQNNKFNFNKTNLAFKNQPSGIVPNSRTDEFISAFFPGTSVSEWNNWHWQIRHSIRDYLSLSRIISLTKDEKQVLKKGLESRPVAITPYYLSLIWADPYNAGLRKTVIPLPDEYVHSPCEEDDPLHEDNDSPLPGLVHRYPDRVLFLATNFCSTLCRYCTRSRMVIQNNLRPFNSGYWQRAVDYIKAHSEVRDVLVSGGDPLTLPDSRIEWLLDSLRRIEHVEIIRIGSKVPAVLPMRITPQLVRMLRNYHPLFVSLHFTHPSELTDETREACERLADAGIPLGSQTVLLKGVNDDPDVMKSLMQGLLKMRVRPYYLYQCDPVSGTSHFRTAVSRGIDIISCLRGHTSGYAVPSYVIDAPAGGGKIPLLPEYNLGHEDGSVVLRNYQNRIFRYPDEFAGS